MKEAYQIVFKRLQREKDFTTLNVLTLAYWFRYKEDHCNDRMEYSTIKPTSTAFGKAQYQYHGTSL